MTTTTMTAHEARMQALREVPCKSECRDSLCLCDEDTRHSRLLSYAVHMRTALNSTHDVLRALREENRRLREEIQELEGLGG